MEESMFFFEGLRGRRLLGFLHPPTPSSSKSLNLGLIYCHPFAEERNQSQGIAVRTARALAAQGIAVFRFDFSGCGDSEGLLEDATLNDWVEEIGLAVKTLREKVALERVGVWGLRLGANLAARFAHNRTDLALGIFWQPLPDFKLAMTQFLRQKLSSELTGTGSGEVKSVKGLVQQMEAGESVEVMGYPITIKLYSSMVNEPARFANSLFTFPTIIFAINESDEAPEGLKQMAKALVGIEAEIMHIREAPFWDRYWRWESPRLAEETVRWTIGLS